MEPWQQFRDLFTGSLTAYGEWVPDRDPPASTKHSKPSDKQYQDHLKGVTGLGIVPVNSEGMSRFGAIDIDIDTIDHALLYKNVAQKSFALNVCRSKSGGAHLFLFVKTAIQASQVRQILGRWAAILGYPTAEIFPKQNKTTKENHGSWINLPYFGGDTTTRYCVGPDGSLSLAEFLNGVVYFDPKVPEKTVLPNDGPELPPCLARMEKDGVVAGYRNSALFNYAVFYRKSSPENWETKVATQNSQYFNPPLEYREVSGVVDSVSRARYQYSCDQEPLVSLCDRKTCITLPFGVGHMPWQEHGSYDDLSAQNLRKLLTNPPKYILEVNGKDITMDWEDLFTFQRFKSKVGKEANLIIASIKQASWEQTVKDLLATKVDIVAPVGASTMGLVIEKFQEFLVLRERATEKEDILRGLPIQVGGLVMFRMTDFKHYLQGAKLDKVEGADFFLALSSQGVKHQDLVVNGREIEVWTYPIKNIKEQTEDFKVPNFEKDFNEV